MNLNTILDIKQKNILKANGIMFHNKMTTEEIDEFTKELLSSKIHIEIIKDILETIEDESEYNPVYDFENIM